MRDPAMLEERDLRTKMPRFQPDNWPQNLMLIEQFVALAEQAGVTPAQLALKWVLSRGHNVHVIPGTTNLQHLADNVQAADIEVSASRARRGRPADQSRHGRRAPLSRRDPADDRHGGIRLMGAEGTVRAAIGYTERTGKKPYFYANAHEKDYVPLKPAEVEIADARGLDTDLDREGFVLVQHKSAVEDLTDLDAVAKVHSGEIAELLKRVTGCDHVEVMPRGILRFSEKLGENEAHDNSHPARFAHVDMAKEAAAEARAKGAPEGKTVVRSAQYNMLASALRRAAGCSAGAALLPVGRARRPDRLRRDLRSTRRRPGVELRQLCDRAQPGPPLVLLFEHAARRGDRVQDQRERSDSGAADAARSVRQPARPARCAAAGEPGDARDLLLVRIIARNRDNSIVTAP